MGSEAPCFGSYLRLTWFLQRAGTARLASGLNMRRVTGTVLKSVFLTLTLCALLGCESAPRNMPAVLDYYAYDFAGARKELRGNAELRNDEQVLLDNLRLGMSALADGDTDEAERALSHDLRGTPAW